MRKWVIFTSLIGLSRYASMYKNTAYTRRSPETDIGAENAPFILLIT